MAARRGRPANIQLTHEHRGKIKASLIINALQEHTLGRLKMSQTQITAGVALLRKCLPDLNATSVSGDPANPITHRVIITGVRRAGDLPHQGVPLTTQGQMSAPRVIEIDVPRITSKDH
jgi:hypothetical protein